jgi:hypothetical protein
MQTKLRSKVTLLFMTLGMLLAFAGVALADQINADGDIVAPNNQTTVNLGDVDPGQTLAPEVSFQLNCNSQQHANPGGTISLNYSAAGSTIPAGGSLNATNASILVPSTWPVDNTGSCTGVANVNDTGNSKVTITAPKSPGAKSFVVTYDIVAPTDANGSTGIQGTTTRSVTYNMNVRNKPPTISSIDGAGAVTEGDQEIYTINASDPDETTLSYSLSVVSGDATVVSGGNTSTPTVKFNSPGDVVLRASVSDGVNTAVTLDKTVSVASANTAPVVSVTGVNDPSYEIGSEPTPGCSVVDAEDTNATVDPVFDRSALSHGLGTVTVTCSYEDTGGLSDSDTVSYTIVDTGDPTASHQLSAAANGNGWHKADFTITLNGSDSGSGVKEIRYTINGGTEQTAAGDSKVLNIDTEGVKTISYYSVDWAGNDSTVGNVTVKLDKTAPQVAYKTGSATPAANAAGWNNTNVTVTFEANDPLSGMGATDADKTATNTATTSGEGTNVTVGSPAFTDRAGNTAAADTATSPDFKIDKTKPTVTVTGVTNGATYTTSNVPTPDCETKDQPLLSGVKTPASVNVTGGTGGFGTLTATCSGAVDNADNNQAAPVSVTYSVKAAFNGFLQPIDGHSVNTGKFGRTYPIKWQLRDSSGALISDSAAQLLVGMMTGGQKAVSCTSFDLSDSDALEEATTGNTALRYDATSDQFIYNYKAPTSGTCYVFAIRYADGLTTQQINFKFTK